jgi:hypothetical protein
MYVKVLLLKNGTVMKSNCVLWHTQINFIRTCMHKKYAKCLDTNCEATCTCVHATLKSIINMHVCMYQLTLFISD